MARSAPCGRAFPDSPPQSTAWHSACSIVSRNRLWGGWFGNSDRLLLRSNRSIRGEGYMLEQPNQVLVIDDDEAAREILVELLGRIGYHAFAASDGNVGLEWLAGAAAPPQA